MSDKGYPEGGSHRPTNLPYGLASEAGQDFPMRMGGDVLAGIALVNLNVGDVVHLSTTVDNWTKDTTPANYAGVVGVVVGGQLTADEVVQQDSAIGTPAALATQRILVMVWGIAKVVSDLVAIALNAKVTGGSVTAGRVSTTGAASGNFVGGTLDAATGIGQVIRLAVNMVG